MGVLDSDFDREIYQMSVVRNISGLLDQYCGPDYSVFVEAMEAVRREFGNIEHLSEVSRVEISILNKIYSGEYTRESPPPHLVYSELFHYFCKYLPLGKYHFPTSDSKIFCVIRSKDRKTEAERNIIEQVRLHTKEFML